MGMVKQAWIERQGPLSAVRGLPAVYSASFGRSTPLRAGPRDEAARLYLTRGSSV